MNQLARLVVIVTVVLFGMAVTVPVIMAAGDPEPSPLPEPKSKQKEDKDKKKKKKKSEQEFRDGYRSAYALVQAGRYAAAFAAFKALDEDDHPDVANYLGYTARKLGQYDASKYWYERALAADPKHVRTWQYYGMWHVEQGNFLKAADFLKEIEAICGGTACKEYQDLKGGMEGTVAY